MHQSTLLGVHIGTNSNAMKNIFNLIIAGIIGGLTFYGATQFIGQDSVQEENSTAKLVSSSSSYNPHLDFVEASKIATDAVVHIYAEESELNVQDRMKKRRNNNPFAELFGDDFFGGDFFNGSPFGNFYGPKNGTGSGVIVSEDGYIVTNNHVVGFADNIVVTLNDGRKVDAVKIGTDPSTDLALIKITIDEKLKVLDYADSDKVEIGEWVLAVGNPFSYLRSTVTAGIVSAKGRDLDIIKSKDDSQDRTIEEFIQTDAVVNPGNSGGALVNADGQLIGINTAIASPTGSYAGYSFAIPSNVVKRIVKDIQENGDIERVNLGLGGYDVDDKIAEEFDLNVTDGFYIGEVKRGSSAQLAGLLPGDVLTKMDGRKVKEYEDIKDIMKYTKAGDDVECVVNRNGKERTFMIKLRRTF